MSRIKVIGMLGGMSWESSAEYYRLANEIVRARLGGLHSARIVLASSTSPRLNDCKPSAIGRRRPACSRAPRRSWKRRVQIY
jgi:aspartate/glutamate racemase